ncbi:Interactor of constitutive active ROPs [Arachis hypogaea]|nr:Interactor of constitutive active ROPs [Arachis hypogaea]
MKAEMMDKETTLESISEENEILKNMEFNKVLSESVAAEIEAAKAVERVAAVKLGIAMEEADRSNQKAARIAEQLEEAQALKSEMEAELRRLKVQCDQWRKAAETAASLLSTGKGKLTERSLSLDNKYNIPLMNNKYEPCCDDIIIDDDDDFQRKKYGNMLKKIGILWKKPHK